MEVVDPRDFIAGGIFREKDFRDKVLGFDWAKYLGKAVLIQGCGSKNEVMPTWAFLVIAAELATRAKFVGYGETARPIPIVGKLGGYTATTSS